MIRGVNFLTLLEFALNRGKPTIGRSAGQSQQNGLLSQSVGPGNPVREGIDTGDPAGFASVDDLMAAWKAQLDHMLDTAMPYFDRVVGENGSHGKYSANPLLSALMRDCVETATDIAHGGARYNLWHVLAEAVANAADAFSAIDSFVYEKKLISLPELAELLRRDWEGGEELRQRFLSGTERFGNGQERPDGFAREMLSHFAAKTRENAAQAQHCLFAPCVATFSWVVSIGKRNGASADGRRSGEPIAANMSPAPGADVSGPTAAIASYLGLPVLDMPGGSPLDLRLNKLGLEDAAGLMRIEALIRVFLEGGGPMLTLTITSAEELRRAMVEPDKYRHLRVRMGGWSAYFVMLSREAQLLQIQRASSAGAAM
jgi:formate C-acetyltransferase